MRFLKFLLLSTWLLTNTSAKELEVIELTSDNHINFNMPFTSDFVSKKQIELADKLSKLPNSKPFYIVLNTPGGSIDAGNDLISFIKAYKKKR
jgi:ATP-dependent protease ClpP protease subunit